MEFLTDTIGKEPFFSGTKRYIHCNEYLLYTLIIPVVFPII